MLLLLLLVLVLVLLLLLLLLLTFPSLSGIAIFLLGVVSYAINPTNQKCDETTGVCKDGDSNINGVGVSLFVGIFGILGGKKGNKSFIITFLVFCVLALIGNIALAGIMSIASAICVGVKENEKLGGKDKYPEGGMEKSCDTINLITLITYVSVVVDLVGLIGASMSVCCGKADDNVTVVAAAPVAAVEAVKAAP